MPYKRPVLLKAHATVCYLSSRSNEVEALKTTLTTDTPTMPASIHSVLTSVAEGGSVKSKQALEWSRLLFKCIKPVGEPEFRLNGDIGTSANYSTSYS